MWSPEQLLALKTTGSCELELTEALFDLDYPGQYLRRIKSVSLTRDRPVHPFPFEESTVFGSRIMQHDRFDVLRFESDVAVTSAHTAYLGRVSVRTAERH